MEISNSVVVITGASTGIGRAVATHLHDLGAHLVLAARSAAPLHALADELDGSLTVPTDVTDPQAATRLVDAAIERFGRIDVLINNAGRAMARPVEHIDLAELTDLIELNVIAPLRLLQLVAPRMREQGSGQIITISSQAATKAIPFIGGYAATKSALRTLSLTAREELAADGITVSVVAPAIVDTAFGQNTPSPEPETLRRAHDGTLLPHVVTPQAVADAVAEIIRSGEAEVGVLPR